MNGNEINCNIKKKESKWKEKSIQNKIKTERIKFTEKKVI